MSRDSLRLRAARQLAKRKRGKWIETTDQLLHNSIFPFERAWKNNRFVVMLRKPRVTPLVPVKILMVQSHFNEPISNHWAELQRIKNELIGSESTAIEFYPPESKLIDDHNIYWLWVFDNPVFEGVVYE